ncbi:MAG: hypothetical protein PHE09_21055 [Oscillospiraceae bacterium]|nr:hypothetical protein [Oscillospiraceae bacterium]
MNLSAYAAELAVMHDKTAWLFTKVKVPSDYIGDTYQWAPAGTVPCSVHPVTDKRSIELYGPRVEQMQCLHLAPDAALSDGMGAALSADAEKPEYKVISVKHRQTHTYALIEVIKVGN